MKKIILLLLTSIAITANAAEFKNEYCQSNNYPTGSWKNSCECVQSTKPSENRIRCITFDDVLNTSEYTPVFTCPFVAYSYVSGLENRHGMLCKPGYRTYFCGPENRSYEECDFS